MVMIKVGCMEGVDQSYSMLWLEGVGDWLGRGVPSGTDFSASGTPTEHALMLGIVGW